MIELIVVLAIMAIMSSIIIFNYNGFNSNVSLENLSQDIALTIRKAQVMTMGIKGVTFGTSGNEVTQFPGYGIHFELPPTSNSSPFLTNLTKGTEKSFILFANLVNTDWHTYDQTSATLCGASNLSITAGSENECLDIINFIGADKIKEFCIRWSW
jgi:type II secretory pathway pseudopilin PulG